MENGAGERSPALIFGLRNLAQCDACTVAHRFILSCSYRLSRLQWMKVSATCRCQLRGASCRDIRRPWPYEPAGVVRHTAGPLRFQARGARRPREAPGLHTELARLTDTRLRRLRRATSHPCRRRSDDVAGRSRRQRERMPALQAPFGAGCGLHAGCVAVAGACNAQFD
jgi:hypothetical protein